MLKTMRHNAKYFYVLFFIVILSFIFWGVGKVDQTSSGGIVAEVGKYKITQEDYYRAYDNAFKFYRDMYKEKFDEEMQKKLDLKNKVLDSLINNKVLLIAAAENGIKVSDEELNDAITKEAAFMKDGVFDSQVYQNTLRLSRISPEAYEAMKREEITATKMSRLIELSVYPAVADLGSLSADDQTMKALKDAMLKDAKDKAVKDYIDGFKKSLKIKEYRQLIS